MTKELYDNDVDRIVGGQKFADNVMGIPGLTACTGAPRENNPEGIFFKKHGVYLTQWEAMDLIKNQATRDLDPSTEGFIEEYINSYNEAQSGRFLK